MNQNKFVKLRSFRLIKMDQVAVGDSNYKEVFIKQFSDLFMGKPLLNMLEIEDVKEFKELIYKISRKHINQCSISGKILFEGAEVAIDEVLEKTKMLDYIVEFNRVPGKNDNIAINLLILKDKISN